MSSPKPAGLKGVGQDLDERSEGVPEAPTDERDCRGKSRNPVMRQNVHAFEVSAGAAHFPDR